MTRHKSTIMEKSPYERLAPELRNRIYELALRCERPLEISHFPSAHGGYWREMSRQINGLALALTCKRVHEEAAWLFYAINTFFFFHDTTKNGIANLRAFRGVIGTVNSSAMRSVVIDRAISKASPDEPFLQQLCDEAKIHPDCALVLDTAIRYWPTQALLMSLRLKLGFGRSEYLWDAAIEDMKKRSEEAVTSWKRQELEEVHAYLVLARVLLGISAVELKEG